MTPGLVTEYECREAARFVLVSWAQWLAMDEAQRAYSVAHYRLHSAIEANVSDAHTQYLDSQSRRANSGRRR